MFHYIPQPTTETLEYSFDAYGRRRSANDWSVYLDDNDKALFADRGFTGHEHLDDFHGFMELNGRWYDGPINMNGRLYDPQVGRFLSPDNYVQSPDFTQSFNRYSYCLNNPLRYTDPSGDFAEFLIAGAFFYLKGAHDNRDKVTGKWSWNPVSWFGKDNTGVVVGLNTSTDFTNVNYFAGFWSPDYSPVLSYNPNYGLGVGDVTTPGAGAFYYPSYNPPSAETVANRFISEANRLQSERIQDISQAGLNFIAGYEGFSSTIYKDVAGLQTIGYGHLIKSGESFGTLSRSAATQLLRKDASFAVNAINEYVTVPLTQHQYDALTSLTFNIGANAFSKSTVLRNVNSGNTLSIDKSFMMWNKARIDGVLTPIKGLTNRRQAEADLFINGNY